MREAEPQSQKLLVSAQSDLFDSELGLFDVAEGGLAPNQRFFSHVPVDEGQIILLPFQIPQAVRAEELLSEEELANDDFKLWLYESKGVLMRFSQHFQTVQAKKRGGEVVSALWSAIAGCRRSVSIEGKELFFVTRESFREEIVRLGLDLSTDVEANVRKTLSRATRFFLSRGIVRVMVEQKGRYPRILSASWPLDLSLLEEEKGNQRKSASTAVVVSGKDSGARVITNQMRAISAGLPSSNIDKKTGKPERRYVSTVMLPIEGDMVAATHEIESSTELGHMIQEDMHAVSTVNALIVHRIYRNSRIGAPPSKIFRFTLDELAMEMGRKKVGRSMSTKEQVEISEQLIRAGNSVHLFSVDDIKDKENVEKYFGDICSNASRQSLFLLGDRRRRITRDGEALEWFNVEVEERVYNLLEMVSKKKGFLKGMIPPATYFTIAHRTSNALSGGVLDKLINLCFSRIQYSGGRMSALNLNDIAEYFYGNEGASRPNEKRDRLLKQLIGAHEGTHEERRQLLALFKGTDEVVIRVAVSFLKITIFQEKRSISGAGAVRQGLFQIDYCPKKLSVALKEMPDNSMMVESLKLLLASLEEEEKGGELLISSDGYAESVGVDSQLLPDEEISFEGDEVRTKLMELLSLVSDDDVGVSRIVSESKKSGEAKKALLGTIDGLMKFIRAGGLDENKQIKGIQRLGGFLYKSVTEPRVMFAPQAAMDSEWHPVKFMELPGVDQLIEMAECAVGLYTSRRAEVEEAKAQVLEAGISMMEESPEKDAFVKASDAMRAELQDNPQIRGFVSMFESMARNVEEQVLVDGLKQHSKMNLETISILQEWVAEVS